MKKTFWNKKIKKNENSLEILDIPKNQLRGLAKNRKYTILLFDKYDPISLIHSNNIKKIIRLICMEMPKLRDELYEIMKQFIDTQKLIIKKRENEKNDF